MIINIKVISNSGRQEIIKIGESYKVYLKANAEEGKANLELLKFLKKYFKKNVRIIRGFRSKEKIIEVD